MADVLFITFSMGEKQVKIRITVDLFKVHMSESEMVLWDRFFVCAKSRAQKNGLYARCKVHFAIFGRDFSPSRQKQKQKQKQKE